MFSLNKKIFLGCSLLLSLYACSNDDPNAVAPLAIQMTETGESSAKTSEAFNLNNVRVDGRAVTLSRKENGPATVYHLYELASKVRMYELDSVTLEPTGDIWRSFILDTNGNFRFDSLSLHSPYVMIEAEPSNPELGMNLNISTRAIIDVRKSKDVSVNVLTYLESFRLRHLVASGVAFDAAKTQAMREVLDAFGLYDEPLDYDKKDNAHAQEYLDFAGFFYINIFLDSVVTVFSQSGMLRNIDSLSMESLVNWAVCDIDATNKQYVDYAANFLSSLHGFGKCTPELEGTSFEVTDGYYHFQCTGNQWKTSLQGFKQIDFSEGEMTDSRDGKTYKTVTYNINGSAQTWMAENLDYGDGVHKEWCFEIKSDNSSLNSVLFKNVFPAESSGCSAYGGLYRAYDALMLDTTFLVENALDTCIANRLKNWLGNSPVAIDTLEVLETCYYDFLNEDKVVHWADSVETANGHVQGICPDGWHIPTGDEWKALWTLLDGVSFGDDLLGDPSGFGLNAISQESKESGFVQVKEDVYFAMKPQFLPDPQIKYWSWSYRPHNPQFGYRVGPAFSFIRCVKN